MRIQHNIMAMNAYRNYNRNTSALSKNLEKLSSGYKINRAGDDAAGLAISEKMRAQITGLNAAQKNVKDGISLVKTAEGAMQEIQDMLNRMDYLATQSANGTYDNTVDRANLQKEVDALRTEINRIADSANFNGIKLLDGSLDAAGTTTISKDSAISNIQSTDYSAAGASPAFEATYVTNRPEAATKQTNAEFVISLDDLGFTGAVKAGDKFTMKVGDATIEYEVQGDGDVTSAAQLAEKLAACGRAMDGNNAEFAGGTATPDPTKDTTAKWNELTGADANAADKTGATGTNQYISIKGHWYKMSATGKDITFTQVDNMGTSGENVDPNFEVNVKYTQDGTNKAAAENKMTGTVNDHVQKTQSGVGIGSSHQAQVDVAIDFSKIKDGDKLVVGDTTYVFKIGKDSQTAAATGAGTNEKLIDLSTLLKEDADLADEGKLNQAMTQIVKDIDGTNTNTTWTSGNFGIEGTVGTISFQSKSSYTDDNKTIGTGGTPDATTNELDKANMTTEAKVMAQFRSERAASNATTSFDIDVTKIKKGDTFSINGVKFEFTDTAQASDSEANAIDLSSIGDIDGDKLLPSQTSAVMTAVKTAVAGVLGANYGVSTSGNTLTIESKDNAATAVKENKVAAKVELDAGAYAGEALVFQIGDTADSFNQMSVSVGDMHTSALKIDDISIALQNDAQAAIQTIKDAINYVSSVRGDLGATQNRLEHTANNLSVMAENIQDAESTIRDTDVAEEMMAYTKNNILIQSAQAMLAQANAVPQGVLQLLG